MEKQVELTVGNAVRAGEALVYTPGLSVSFAGSDGETRTLRAVYEGDLEDFDPEWGDMVDDVILDTPEGSFGGYRNRATEYLRKQRDMGVRTVTIQES